MKSKFIILVMAVVLVAGGSVMADIVGSDHDFSGELWSDGQICEPCHTPHNAMAVDAAPLWNHELTVSTYDTHSGTGVATVDALDDRSILCMSCHDGTVALDSFGGNSGTQLMSGSEKIGTDLTNDHPIGADAVYPLVSWMNDPANWENTPYGFTLRDMEVNGTPERVVSCTTCHEPHKRGNNEHMLWVNNNASALCLTCHLK